MLLGFRAQNHQQQVSVRGARNDVDDRETDPRIWEAWDARFEFTLDAAADHHNAKTQRYYTRETNGLAQPWSGHVWCNPPYSDIRPWVQKAWDELAAPGEPATSLIVMLVPANRTEQGWWQDLIEPHRDRPESPLTVEFLRGRLRFLEPGEQQIRPNSRPPFGCCLLIWRRAA